ncbi:M56 family metallopeptidase [Henriciella aquimarina]|uniref:M56 family metallopeptidase n=1 Tax=Henriciella aquimarina TaxID=545261 RepID=UPI0009FD8367|nr:M56 family metallopeptidase [Henriciella aquimarina]
MTAFADMNPWLASSLQTSLAVTVLIALVLMVRKPFARHFGAKAAYALWLVPVARLFMPPVAPNVSLFGLLAPAAPERPVSTVREIMVSRHDVASISHTAPPAPAPIAAPEALPLSEATSEPGLLSSLLTAMPDMLLPLWAIGTVLMLGLAWYRQAVFHRLIGEDSAPASETVHATALDIAETLNVRRSFDVRTSLLNGSPLVTGFLKPVILLPEWFEADYSPREQRDALTHELMHVKRGDLFALQAAQIILAVQWFNPLAHMGIRAFRVDQEAACDADVLRAGTSSAFSYGRTLVKAARLAGPADCAFSGANLTLAHPIKERLILMQNAAPTFRRRLLGTTLAVTLGSAAVFATASCAAAAAPKDQSTTELAGGNDRTEETERKTRVYRFSSHKDGDDHQFVLLSDPFEALQPRLDKVHDLNLSDLEEEMRVLSIEMSDIGEMDFSSLAALGELGKLGELEGLAELGNLSFDFDLDFDGMDIQTVETEDGVKIIIPNQEIFISKLDGDAFEIQIEKAAAIAEAHAERAAALAEAQAERAEKISIVIEKRMEEKGARMEALGEEMEARIEAAFEGGLEDDLEAAGDVVGDLAEQCEDRDIDLKAPVVLTTRGDDGKTYRALCVSGERSRLADEDVKAFVRDHASLTPAEKERFEQQRTMEYEFSVSRDD